MRFMRRVKELRKIIHAMICTQFGYVVHVPEYKATHYCMSFDEYMEWLESYPKQQQMIVMVKGKKHTWRMDYVQPNSD